MAISTDGCRFLFNVLHIADNLLYEWDFGDVASGECNTAFGPEAAHRYVDAGVYVVHLTITAPDETAPLRVRRAITAVGGRP